MPPTDRRAALAEIQQEELQRTLGDLLRRRVQVLPLTLVVVWLVWHYDPLPWRRIALTGAWTIALVLVTGTALATRRRGLTAFMLHLNLAVMALITLCVVALMGGVDSPLAPATFVMAFLLPLLAPGRYAYGLIAVVVLGLLALTVAQVTGHMPFPMPSYFAGEGYASTARMLWCRGLLLAWVNTAMLYVGTRVRAGFDQVGARSIRARDEVLADHDEQLRAMTTLAGEIAHELKNPLASVKGLAALVAKDLDGRAAEQLAVLRREADRMQGILEDFLNFSRPLVPLQQEEVALDGLAKDVVELYAAITVERGVRIEIDAPMRVMARCDRRKLKQVLINLLQNALDASPRGGRVRVVLERAGDQIHLRVVDEGGGLRPEIAARVFEAGVTTKERGSGLGLTVSRLLARQHGGELTLASDGRGCTAELRLPGVGLDAAEVRA